MAISVSGTTITFNDATTQTTAATSAPADLQTFNSTGTWTKPTAGQTMAFVQVWGGGGGGGRANSPGGASGGGGGGYNQCTVPISQLATQTVTVGGGGAGATALGAGSTGGESWLTVNSARFSAFGGGPGTNSTSAGGGGGTTSAGVVLGIAGDPKIWVNANVGFMGAADVFGIFHGGGGQASTNDAPGSIYGGGGGTGGGASGKSIFGGNGGSNSAGSVPGGGGGCSNSANVNGLAGGSGRIIITSW
jgi:hypothetical protein